MEERSEQAQPPVMRNESRGRGILGRLFWKPIFPIIVLAVLALIIYLIWGSEGLDWFMD